MRAEGNSTRGMTAQGMLWRRGVGRRGKLVPLVLVSTLGGRDWALHPPRERDLPGGGPAATTNPDSYIAAAHVGSVGDKGSLCRSSRR